MKINWKLRFKNKATLAAIIATAILLAQQLGLKLPDNINDVANTALTLLVLLGVVSDPTTSGLSDSEQAMNYNDPKQEAKHEEIGKNYLDNSWGTIISASFFFAPHAFPFYSNFSKGGRQWQ